MTKYKKTLFFLFSSF